MNWITEHRATVLSNNKHVTVTLKYNKIGKEELKHLNIGSVIRMAGLPKAEQIAFYPMKT